MAYEESGGQYIDLHIKARNVQLGDNNILNNSGSGCLIHENSCPKCEFVVLHRAVSLLECNMIDVKDNITKGFVEYSNNHSDLIVSLNLMSSKVEELHRSQKGADKLVTLNTPQVDTDRLVTLNTPQVDTDRSVILNTPQVDTGDRSVTLNTQQDNIIDNINLISLSVETLHTRFDKIVWDQRHLNSRLDNFDKAYDEFVYSKIKNKKKGGKIKNGIKRIFNKTFKHKPKANDYYLENSYSSEDEDCYATISDNFEIPDMNLFNEGASQEQQSFTGESSQDQQPLSGEAIQNQQSLREGVIPDPLRVESSQSDETIQNQQSLIEEKIQTQQSLIEEEYSNLCASGKVYPAYQRLNNLTNTDSNYTNVNEATISTSESLSCLVPPIASTVQITHQPNKIYRSQYGTEEWDVLF